MPLSNARTRASSWLRSGPSGSRSAGRGATPTISVSSPPPPRKRPQNLLATRTWSGDPLPRGAVQGAQPEDVVDVEGGVPGPVGGGVGPGDVLGRQVAVELLAQLVDELAHGAHLALAVGEHRGRQGAAGARLIEVPAALHDQSPEPERDLVLEMGTQADAVEMAHDQEEVMLHAAHR